MTDQTYRVKSGPLYLVRFHEDGAVPAKPADGDKPPVAAKPGKPNLAYQPVFSRNIADALVFTDSEEAGAAAQLVQQHGKDASLDPEPPKAAEPVAEPVAGPPTAAVVPEVTEPPTPETESHTETP